MANHVFLSSRTWQCTMTRPAGQSHATFCFVLTDVPVYTQFYGVKEAQLFDFGVIIRKRVNLSFT